MKKLNILVIGGTGFLGSNLVGGLERQGHNIRVLSRGNVRDLVNYQNVEYIVGDINNNEDLDKSINGMDYVYHLASTTNPKSSENDLIFDVSTNLSSSINILKGCVKNNIKKFIFCSSGGTVYGNHNKMPISENFKCEPISSYGLVKYNIELYIKYFNYKYNLDYEILRLSNPYGKKQFPGGSQGVIPTFIKNILNDNEIKVFGDGSSIRDYLYIDDFIDLSIKLLSNNKKNNILNVGSGNGTSIGKLIEKMELLIGKKANINFLPPRKFDVSQIYLNIDKVSKVYDWKPKITLDEGLQKTIDWVKIITYNR